MKRWILFIFLSILFACSSDESSERVVASVGDVQLTEKDVINALGDDYDVNSISYKSFIQRWIKNQVLVINANEKLSDNEKDFSKKMNDYYHSLLTYTFEQKIINERLNTTVSRDEIKKYYDENPEDFELKENIVSVRYIKVSKKNKDLQKFRRLIQYKNDESKERLLDLSEKHGAFCVINEDWMSLEELKTLIPIKLYNDEHFLSHYNYTEAPDNDYIWLVYFVKHRLKDNISPLNLVGDKIKSIILNQRKLKLIKEIEEELYQKALSQGKIKYE